MTTQNLDRLCAHFGHKMANEVNEEFKKSSDTENLITKSLGILQENGVYAFLLYLASQVKPEGDKESKSSKAARILANTATGLLANDPPQLLQVNNYGEALEAIRKEKGLADNLDNLLLAKRLLEQALIYARYHAKALRDKQ